MPWSIKLIEDEYCVIKDSTGENEGCHDTREEAVDQLRALNAAKAESAIGDNIELDSDLVPRSDLPPAHIEAMSKVAMGLKDLSEIVIREHFVSVGELAAHPDEDCPEEELTSFNLRNLESALERVKRAIIIVRDNLPDDAPHDRLRSLLEDIKDDLEDGINDYPPGRRQGPLFSPIFVASKPINSNDDDGVLAAGQVEESPSGVDVKRSFHSETLSEGV